MSKQKLIMVILIGTATLILLYAAYWLVGKQAAQPLEKELLNISGIKQVDVIKGKQQQPTIIKVQPDHSVASIAWLYQQVDKTVSDRLDNYEIQVVSAVNTEAELLFYQLSLIFYSGLAQGDYEKMAHDVAEAAMKKGWQTEIQMDENNIYVTLKRNNQVWYRIIKRYPRLVREENVS